MGIKESLVARSDVVGRPRHQVVRVGQDVRFCCRSDNPSDTLRWDYRREPNDQQIQLYNSRRIHRDFTDRYSISNLSDTHRDLEVRSVQPTDAGTYICFAAKNNRSFAATLVVLESEPKCRECRTPDQDGVMYREVECNVRYTGNWPPSFQCHPPATNPNESSTYRVQSISVTYRQRFVTGRTRSGDVIECWMHFNYSELPTPIQKFEYDREPVAYIWISTPFKASESMPVWVYFYMAITTTIIVVQTVALTIICYRKTSVVNRRLNDDDYTIPVSTATFPEAHVYTSVEYSSVVNAETPTSPSDSRLYDQLLQNRTGPVYTELAESPRRVISSNPDVSVNGNSNNNADSSSVAADIIYTGISTDLLGS